MLSLFYKILELRAPVGTQITIFKPNKEKQIILLKGKLGLYKLDWLCTIPNCVLPNISIWTQKFTKLYASGCSSDNQQNIQNDSKSTQTDLTSIKLNDATKNLKDQINNDHIEQLTDFLTFKKENKLFIYNKKCKEINDFIYIKNLDINLDTNFIWNYFESNSLGLDLKPELKIQNENIINMGFIIPYKKSVLKGQPKFLSDVKEVFILKNEKFVENQIENINKQFKNIIKGITQGFSINLELKGIGYSAQLQSQKEIKSEASLHNNQPSLQNINESTPLAIKISASGGQIETNISKIKKYILSKDKPCKITNQNFLEKILLTFKPKQTNITYNLIDKKYLERQGYRIYDDFSKLSFQSFQQEQILYSICSNVIDNSKKEQTNVLPKTSRANKIIMSNFVKDVQNDLARNLTLRLGTSHNIIFPLYKYEICVKILTQQNNFVTLVLFGISHEIIKHVAAEIFLLKKPEPYKGKGIRYDGEKFFAKEKTKKN